MSTRELLAASLVGRWRGGAPLTLAPDRDDQGLGADPLRNNDFSYAADPHGRQVPLGSHMRRMNFIFFSATAMATMELLQQEWVSNGNFMNLGDERDPNVGLQEDGATFTIPEAPVRRRVHGIETFKVLRGASTSSCGRSRR